MSESNPPVEVRHVRDLKPDQHNANRGTARGNYALGRSLEEYGAGRSILLDKDGNIIAGNKTYEKFGEQGGEDVIVVKTRGDQLVAVQREDLDINDPRARALAYADNRVAELDLEWDAARMAEDIAGGVELELFWRDDELDKLMTQLADNLDITLDGEGPEEALAFTVPEGLAPSHIRMVQLYLDSATQPEFMEHVEALARHFGTSNPTDTVMAVLRSARALYAP